MDGITDFLKSKYDAEQQAGNAATVPPSDIASTGLTVPQPAPTTSDPIESFLMQRKQQEDQTARTAAITVVGNNPDKVAEARTVGQQIGLPQAAVATDLPGFDKQLKQQQAAQAVASSPILSTFLANNQEAAQYASDDFQNLSVVGKLAEAFTRGAKAGVVGNTYGRLGFRQGDLALQGKSDPTTDAQRSEAGAWLTQQQTHPLPGAYGTAQWLTSVASGLVDNYLHGGVEAAEGAAIGAGAGAITGGVLSAPLAAVGFGIGANVGMLKDMLQVHVGNTQNQLEQARDAAGNPLSEPVKAIASTISGAIAAPFLALGMKFTGGAATEAISKTIGDAVQQAITRPTVSQVVKEISTETIKGGVTGSVINAATAAASMAAEEIAKQISPGQWQTAFNDPATLSRYGSELANAAAEGFMLFGGMHAGISGLSHIADIQAARKAQADVDQFQQLEKGITDSRLRGRAPDIFNEYLKAATGGEAAPLLGIRGDRVLQLYQSYGIDPFSVSHGDDPLFHFVEDMPNKLHQAIVSGGDVHIPTADYATHIAGTKIADELRPDLNFDPMNPRSKSLREAVADVKDSAKRTREGLEAVQKTAAEAKDGDLTNVDAVQRVASDVYNKLKALGKGDHTAAVNAALQAQRYQTRAERAPGKFKDAWEAYQAEGPITIRKQDAKDISGVTVDQADVLINALRSKNIPTDRDIHGKSLLQFIKERGGIIDTGGELRAMDLHKSRPGLVRRDKNAPSDEPGMFREPTGYSGENKFKPDMVAEAAHHAGYIPEHSIDHLYDAIREEVGGRPRYVEENKNQNAHDFRAAVEDLDRYLGERGIDVDKHDNAAIKAMIAEHQLDGGEGGELFQRAVKANRLKRGVETRPSDAGSADAAGRGPGAGDGLAHGTGERLGSISSMEHDPVITLFRKANQSTFSHEMGHKWLVEMLIDAEHPEASDLAKADAAAALKYLGATDRHSLTVDHHEQWARTVEAYLMEGKAPSDALSRVLRQFKDWLTKIYKKLTALDVPINDEIRGVMDRLLASDDAIDAARKDAGAQPLFREKHAPLFESAKDIGMTDPQYKAYLRMIEQAQDVADKRVMAAVTAKLRRERTAAWKEESAAMRPGVEAEMMQRPDLAALACLQDGRNPVTGDPMPVGSKVWKLSRGAIKDMHGTTEAVKMLPHGTTAAKGGIDPDIAASALGYRSGDRLVGALMELESKRTAAAKTSRGSMSWADFRDKLINDEVERRMTERHGDPLHDGSIENEALQAVHSKAALDIVSAELKALANKAGVEPPHTVAQIAEWVRGQMGDEKAISGANARKWVNAERKASRAAEEALLKKNYAEAYKQKQRQQIAMLFAKQSFEVADAIASGRKMFTRMAGKTRLDSIAPEYADRIHELLGSFGFNVKRDPAELQRGLGGTTLEGFVNGKMSDGAEFAIAPWLFDKTQHVRMADITVDQFLDLKDAITSIAHVGRREQEVTDQGKLVELERLAEEMSQAPGINRGKDGGVYMHPENLPGVKGGAAKWGATGRSADGMLLKMEQLFQWFNRDGYGPFLRLFDRLKSCQHSENDRMADLSHKLDELGKSMPKGWEKDLKWVYAPEDHPELMAHDQNGNPRFPIETRAQLLAAALNVGNKDNFNKLVLGFRWAVSHEPGHLEAARSRFMNVLHKELTEHDWRFVQGVWDLFETMAPEIDAMQRRVTGVGMTKVVADPVVTKSGILRGGYYPVVYDPKGSAKAARNAEGGELKTLLENNYYRATTSKGHTKERVENVQMPLLLALDNIPAKLRAHAHDLHWREAITDADKLLGHEKVRGAIASDWGHEYADLMRPWLQSVANEAVRSDARLGAMDDLLRGLRTNTMAMGIGFRVSTILKHGLSALSMSVSELGPIHSAKAIAELFGGSKHGDRTIRQMIMEKSGELRHRMNTIDRDVREALRSVEGRHDFKATMMHWGHLPVAHADLASAMFVWLGGYRKALAEGAGEELAVSQADRLVRNAHGAQGALDLSAIQRGPEALKLMTMFYGFFNHNYNRGRDMIVRSGVGMEKLRDHDFQGAGADFGRVLANSLGYLVIPAIVEAMVSEGLPNDENEEKYSEWLGKALVGQVAGDIPILRDIAKGILTGRDYQATPMESLINSIGHDAKDIARATGLSDGEPSERWLRHAIETPGFLLGLPLGQPAVTVQYLWDIERGYAQPDGVGDFMKGLAFGAPKH